MPSRLNFSPRLPRRWVRRLGGALGAVVLGLAVWLTALHFNGNFHAVVPGALYRSAQPSEADIGRYRAAYGIRTIVNLRGAHPGAPWYDAELAAAARHGIDHVDFRMSARRDLSQADAARLVALLARAEKPILIHCQAGADRSGLAAALYLAAVAGGSEGAAEWQISLRYGHVSLPVIPEYAMDRTWERLEPWLGFPELLTSALAKHPDREDPDPDIPAASRRDAGPACGNPLFRGPRAMRRVPGAGRADWESRPCER